MAVVYLGIGSNIVDREQTFKQALGRLKRTGNLEILKVSSTYYTKPVGGPVQDDYLNGVLKIDTGIPPEKLLDILKDIEKDMGRTLADKDHPRIIDLDILLYGEERIVTDKLTVPHPKMRQRYFVLKGLAEIARDTVYPGTEKTMGDLYEDLQNS